MSQTDRDSLAAALADQQIELSPDVAHQLQRYCELLWAWNEKLNLTRHTTYELFVGRDLNDCLQLAKLLAPGESVLDVGSGGGVPGIVLAILRPDLEISVCESVGKKSAVLADLVEKLELPVPVYALRAEEAVIDERFDTLVARAVGPLWKILTWFGPHWSSFGRLLAVKGPRWVEERGEARHRGLLRGMELRRLVSYPMAGTESESVVLEICAKSK